MEPQNQVRVETLLPAFSFKGFWWFSYVDGVGAMLTYPQARVYFNKWSRSGYKMFF